MALGGREFDFFGMISRCTRMGLFYVTAVDIVVLCIIVRRNERLPLLSKPFRNEKFKYCPSVSRSVCTAYPKITGDEKTRAWEVLCMCVHGVQ